MKAIKIQLDFEGMSMYGGKITQLVDTFTKKNEALQFLGKYAEKAEKITVWTIANQKQLTLKEAKEILFN